MKLASGKRNFSCHTRVNVKFKLSGTIQINKNLKFKKGVGIAIKSKETSSKLASS